MQHQLSVLVAPLELILRTNVNILKCAKNIMKFPNFFVFVLYCTPRRYSLKKPQLKVEIEDGCEAS